MPIHHNRPYFIGIGSPRSASSWIYNCLREHPEICTSILKETRFFSKYYKFRRGLKFYLSFFKNCPELIKTGEFSTDYMMSPKVPYLIHKYFPNVKLIACLRNPVDKIISLYRYRVDRKSNLTILKSDPEIIKNYSTFLEEGYYYKQLIPYFQLFPRSNILILIYDDLKKNPIKCMRNIYKFLELKNFEFIPPKVMQKRNISGYKVGKNKIPLINSFIFRISFIMGNFKKLKRIFLRMRIVEILERFTLFNTEIINSNPDNVREVYNNQFMEKKVKTLLKKSYKKDIEKLEILIEKNLECWK